ncbi:TPA: hypothetical protein ACG830_000539 [Enterococcus faecium]
MKNIQTNLEPIQEITEKKKIVKGALMLLLIAFALHFIWPVSAYADIESSVKDAGNTVVTTIKNVSGAVGAAVIAAGWFGNMIPIVEINQKAKMWIIRAGVSLVGISFTMQLVEWVQGMK